MKKGLLLPAALLGAILAFCLWNSAAMTAHTDRWRDQLEEADRLVRLGVRGFWNFTNVELSSEVENVRFEDVHFADSLLTLSYRITER